MEIRVAKVLGIGEIVINKGLNDGIKEQMELIVYEEGEIIFDPITKKKLGVLEIPKGKFKVLHIQDNISVLLSEYRPQKFNINFGILGEEDSELNKLKSIQVGDKVKIINELKFLLG